jgi:hypothetical protein
MFLCRLCSPEIPKINFHVELDAAKATWLSNDIVMFSTKTGEMMLLTVVYDGRYVNYTYHCPSYYLCNCSRFYRHDRVEHLLFFAELCID